jgi:HlyD family secretion protein
MTDQHTPEELSAAQSTSETQNTTSAEKNSKKSNAIKMVLAVVVIIILGLIAFGLWKTYQPQTLELQGRVEAENIYVSTKVPSRIEELFVESGAYVKKGQPLVRLHSPEIENKKKQALGALQSALALQSTTDRGSQIENIDTLYANWQALQSQANLAQTTAKRGAKLFQEGVISRQRFDEMNAAAASSADLAEGGRQQYLRAKRGSTSEQKSTADAQVEIASAMVDEANALEAETFLHSPIDGQVANIYGNPSELVALGVPIISLLDEKKTWVSLNVREDHYQYLYKQKEISGFIPALNENVMFRVKEISPQGDFATIKTTRQTGGYDIRSFKFSLVPTKPMPNLKVGMSVIFKVQEEAH